MTLPDQKKHLLGKLSKELKEENLAIFAGAGLSASAGFVNWADLLRPVAEELGLDVEKEKADLVSLAQYHYNKQGNNRAELNELLVSNFCEDKEVTENHSILARLPIRNFWTTNYDKLIETALKNAGKVADTKYDKNQLLFTKPKRDAVVYKMHGDVDHPNEAVLTKDNYQQYHVKMQPFINALTGDLTSKTFLFLGFSFSDPNLDYILSHVRTAYSENQRRHYCILRTVQLEDYEDKAEFEYQKRKQGFFIRDLLRYNIEAVMVDEYQEVTNLLQNLEKQHRRSTVFISGAAHDYSPRNDKDSNKFVFDLSYKMISSDLNIVSGFGLGIGSSVISGALENIYMNGGTIRNEQLLLRPFPQSEAHAENPQKLWTQYRNDMLSRSGVALFVFGNKLSKDENGQIELSNGMREEFEIAKTKGLFLLPIGATGYMAKELWTEVHKDFDTLNPKVSNDVKESFEKLGDENMSFDEMINNIMIILTKIAT